MTWSWRSATTFLGLVAVGLTACGGSDGEAAADDGPRIVEVSMTDNAYTVGDIDDLEVEQGDFVIFRFVNDGAVRHEGVVGDELFQQGHADHQHVGGMQMVNAVMVEPGETADLPYRFDIAARSFIGCHEPGHWEGGMRATITVAPTD